MSTTTPTTSPLLPWLRLCRAPNTLTAAADVFAGAALAGGSPFAPAPLIAAAGSALLYAGGVALNDVADVDKDRTLHPGRPLPSGAIPVEAARRVGGALLLGGVLSSLPSAGPGFAVALTTGAAILLYDFVRTSPLGSSLALGAARGLNLLRGAAAVGALGGASTAWNGAAFHAALIAFVTFVSVFEDDAEGAAQSPALRLAISFLPWAYLGPLFVGFGLGGLGGALRGGAAVLPAVLYVVLGMPGTGRATGSIVPRAVFGLVLLDAAYLVAAGRYAEAAVVAAFFPLAAVVRRAIAQRGS